MAATWHDPFQNTRFLNPGVGTLSVFDPPEIYAEEPASHYAMRMWRYEHVSLEIQLESWRLGKEMWIAKKPWWVSL